MMNKRPPVYMPVLRTKDGERRALLNMEPVDKAGLIPLFEVQAPETGMAVDDALQHAIAWIKEAWPDSQEFLIDISQLRSDLRSSNGSHPLAYIADAFRDSPIYPNFCFSLERNDDAYEAAYVSAVNGASGKAGATFRLQQHDLLFWEETLSKIRRIQDSISIKAERITIIADLQSLCSPQTVDSAVVQDRLTDLSAKGFGRLVFMGSNMPESANLPRDAQQEIRRLEVDMWEGLLRAIPSVLFGDYGIVHPTSRYIKNSGMAIPAPKAKYALPTRWQVVKGHKPVKGEPSQYLKIARALYKASWFQLRDFGWGSEQIREIATGYSGKRGNNTDWIAYTTQIHLALTVKQTALALALARSRIFEDELQR